MTANGMVATGKTQRNRAGKTMAEVTAVEPEQAQEQEVENEVELLDEPEGEVEAAEETEKDSKGFDREKFQKQNRELGNLKRANAELKGELSEIKRLLQERPKAETKIERQSQEDTRDDVRELLDEVKNLADDDIISAKTYRDAVSKLGALIKKANKGEDLGKIEKELAEMRKKLDGVESQTSSATAMSKAAAAFDEAYESLSGQYSKFNTKAFKLAREELGEDADANQVAGLATGLLNRLAKRAIQNMNKDSTTKDKTASVKPATSTKGTANVKKGAAPDPDLDDLDMNQLRELAMKEFQAGG